MSDRIPRDGDDGAETAGRMERAGYCAGDLRTTVGRSPAQYPTRSSRPVISDPPHPNRLTRP